MSDETKKKPENETEMKKKWQWADWKQWTIAGSMAAGGIALDQISKAIVEANLVRGEIARVADPWLWIIRAHNDQGMFSMNLGPQFIYKILPLIAIGFVIYLLLQRQPRFLSVLLGGIIGGGLGNFIDRIFRFDPFIGKNYVLDWISVGVNNQVRWATFNIADSLIIGSVILLLVYEFFFRKPEKKPGEEAEPEKT